MSNVTTYSGFELKLQSKTGGAGHADLAAAVARPPVVRLTSGFVNG